MPLAVFLVDFACVLALAMAITYRIQHHVLRRARLRIGNEGESHVGELLDRFGGMDRLDGMVVGDLPELAQTDHLVRGRSCILVIETKRWAGTVSGQRRDSKWRVANRRGTTLRGNPLLQVKRAARIVKALVPEACVTPVVIMAGSARHASGAFPKGVLEMRHMAANIPRMLNEEGTPEQEAAIDAAWDRLVEHAYAPGRDRLAMRYLARVEDRTTRKTWRPFLALSGSLAVLALCMVVAIKRLHLG